MLIRNILTKLNCFRAPTVASTPEVDFDSCATNRSHETQESAAADNSARVSQTQSLRAQARLNHSLSRDLSMHLATIRAWGNNPKLPTPTSRPVSANTRASYQNASEKIRALLIDPHATELRIESNFHITHLPRGVLPERLEVLSLRGCTSLTACPDLQGLGVLKKINLRQCLSLRKPPDLSQSHALQELEMGGETALASAPVVTACPRLRVLNLRRSTHIKDAPDVSNCPDLTRFDMTEVPIQHLPKGVLNLPPQCFVSLSDSHLIDRTELDAVYGKQGYAGPQLTGVVWNTGAEVAFWRREAALSPRLHMDEAFMAVWGACDTGLGSSNLAVFLNRLRNTAEYILPEHREKLKHRVSHLLDQLQQHPDWLQTCLVLVEHGLKACDDLVTFGLLEMETFCANQHIANAVKSGEYDAQVSALIRLGQGMHRLNQLDHISSQRRTVDRSGDPIEMQLAYLMESSNQFDLPVQLQAMKYALAGIVSPQDLDDVTAQLKGPDELMTDAALIEFLVQWEPLTALFERIHPHLKAQTRQAKEQLHLEAAAVEPGGAERGKKAAGLLAEFNADHERIHQSARRLWVQELLVNQPRFGS